MSLYLCLASFLIPAVFAVVASVRAGKARDDLALERAARNAAEGALAGAREETRAYRDRALKAEDVTNKSLAENARLRAELVAKIPDSEIGALAVKAFGRP